MTAPLPGLAALDFAARRRRVLDALGPRAAALFVGPRPAVRSNDVEYPYRQDSDVLYLTGFREPGAAVLLVPGHPDGEYHLFVRPRDPERETWTGRRAGVEGARSLFGADAAHPIEELDALVPKLVGDRDAFYYKLGHHPEADAHAVAWLQRWQSERPRSGKGPQALRDPAEIVHEIRLFKDDAEVERMRVAGAIAREAHLGAMRTARPGMFEYEVEAAVDFAFRRLGAAGPAYPSIVAGGANATILHYVDNDAVLRDGDLLLIDAGAEYDGYCSDVTRTFPIGRRFSPAQRALYDVVLRAQAAAIDAVCSGAGFDAPHQAALRVLTEGLIAVGILNGDVDAALGSEAYRPYFMHRTSHWLGIDVHDVGAYRVDDAPRVLAEGMVLTIEPGLYVAADADAVAPEFRGIGIRIEDDVLVTCAGCEVLSADIPKAVDEIETLRGEALN